MGIGVLHIDLVQNDWGNRRQRRLACVEADGDRVFATHLSERGWELLDRTVDDQNGITTKVVDLDVREAFSLLQSTFRNAYFFATEPHDESTCGFHACEEIEMVSVPEPL